MAESDRDRFHGDVVYEVWRSGGNPDAVDWDDTQRDYGDGIDAAQCAGAEVRRQNEAVERRQAEEREMEAHWEQQQYEAAMEREQEEAHYEAQRAQEDQMPEATTETTFPSKARARLANASKAATAEDDDSEAARMAHDAMEVIEALESEGAALRNSIDFMRERVQAAIEPR